MAGLGRISYIVAVHPAMPAKNIPEFISHAKANPGKIDYASGGTGGSSHLSVEFFESAAGLRLDVMPNLGQRYLTKANWDLLERLEAFAKERRRSMVDIAFGWLAAKPTVASVMAGATRPEQVEQNAAASNCELSAEELAALDALCAQAPG